MSIDNDNTDFVTLAQTRLRDLRLYGDPIDGRAGPATQAALLRALAPMQPNGRGTGAGAATAALDNTDFVMLAQVALQSLGLYAGPIDGHGDADLQVVLQRALSGAFARAGTATPPPNPTAPFAFTVGQWTLADSPSAGGDTLTITISALPADGGSAITVLQYRRNGGAATTLPGGTGIGARNVTVLAATAADIQIRAGNALGFGPWSDTKTATPTVVAGDPTGTATSVTVAPASILGQSNYGASDVAWVNPNNVLVDDATAATFVMPANSTNSQFLKVAFALPSIPTNAKITGIEVSVRLTSTNSTAIRQAYLTFDGELCNKMAWVADSSIPAATLTTVVLGGPGDTFGTTLTAADLNAGRIGFAFRCGRTGTTGTVSAQYVTMKIYYTTLEGIVSRGAAVATANIPNDGGGIPLLRHRLAFPVGMGTPKAIIWSAVGHSKADRNTPGYNARAVNVASATVSVGMAVNGNAGGGASIWNNAGTFVGKNATSHVATAAPNFGGTGNLNTDGQANVMSFGGNGVRPVAWGDGYVDVQFKSASNSPFYVTVTAIYCANAHLYLGDGFTKTPAEDTRVVNCGFQPNAFLTLAIPDAYNTAVHDAYAEFQFGGGKWDGSGWTNRVATLNSSTRFDGGSGSTERALVRNRIVLADTYSHFSNNTNDPTTGEGGFSEMFYRRRLSARSATGYTIERMSGSDRSPTEDNVTVLALDMGSTPFDLEFIDLPAATGLSTIASAYRPSAIVAALTNATVLGNQVNVDAETRAMCMFQASDIHGATHGIVSPNGVNPINATSVTDIEGARVIDTAGTTTFAAKVARMRNAGIELDVTATPGARKALVLRIG